MSGSQCNLKGMHLDLVAFSFNGQCSITRTVRDRKGDVAQISLCEELQAHNVLLDSADRGKVADFGLAWLVVAEVSRGVLTYRNGKLHGSRTV